MGDLSERVFREEEKRLLYMIKLINPKLLSFQAKLSNSQLFTRQ
jgi:hypothetical protein